MGVIPDTGENLYTLDEAVDKIAERYGVPKSVYSRMVRQESGGNHNAVSPKGASSAWQIMPATAKGLGIDASDPLQAAEGGLRILRDNYKQFRQYAQNEKHAWMMAVAGYHGSPQNVLKDVKSGGYGLPKISDGAITTYDHVLKIFDGLKGAELDRSPLGNIKRQAAVPPPQLEVPTTPAGKRLMMPGEKLAEDTPPISTPTFKTPQLVREPQVAGSVQPPTAVTTEPRLAFGGLTLQPDSVMAQNAPPTAPQGSRGPRIPVAGTAPAKRRERVDVRVTDVPPDTPPPKTDFKRRLLFRDKPKDVSNRDWLIDNLVPELVTELGFEAQDVETALRAGIEHRKGTPLDKIRSDQYYEFVMTPEFYDRLVETQGSRQFREQKQTEADAVFGELQKGIPAEMTGADRDLEEFRRRGLADAEVGLLKREDADKAYESLKKDIETWRNDRGFLGIWNQEEWAKLGSSKDQVRYSENFAEIGVDKGTSPKELLDKAYADMRKQYGNASNWVKAQKEFKKRFENAPMSYIAKQMESAAGGVMKVPFEAAASVLKSIAIGSEAFERATGGLPGDPLDPSADQKATYKLGQDLQSLAEGIKVDKDFKGGAAELAGNVFSQVIVQAGLGMATGGALAPALLGGAMGASQAYDKAGEFKDINGKVAATPWERLGGALAAAGLAVPDYFIFKGMLKAGNAIEKASTFQRIKSAIQSRLAANGVAAPVAEKAAVSVIDGMIAELAAKGGVRGAIGRTAQIAKPRAGLATGESVQEMTESSGNNLYAYFTYDPSTERLEKALGINKEKLIEGAAGFFGGLVGATFADMAARTEGMSPDAIRQATELLEQVKDELPEQTYKDAQKALARAIVPKPGTQTIQPISPGKKAIIEEPPTGMSKDRDAPNVETPSQPVAVEAAADAQEPKVAAEKVEKPADTKAAFPATPTIGSTVIANHNGLEGTIKSEYSDRYGDFWVVDTVNGEKTWAKDQVRVPHETVKAADAPVEPTPAKKPIVERSAVARRAAEMARGLVKPKATAKVSNVADTTVSETQATTSPKIQPHKLGDFIEFFGDDAETVSKALEVTVTRRKRDGAKMAGVPEHAWERYKQQLTAQGIQVSDVIDGDITGYIDAPTATYADRPVKVLSESGKRSEVEFEDGKKLRVLSRRVKKDSPAPVQLPISISIDDIPLEHARRAFAWTSFTPEKRADQTRQQYVEHMTAVYEDLAPLAKTPEQKTLLTAELERYRDGYIKREMELLSAKSRTASSNITGPANFPVERNRKALDREARLNSGFIDWSNKAQDSIKKRILDARTDEVKADERWENLKTGIAQSLGWHSSANLAGRLRTLANNGEVELLNKSLDFIRQEQAKFDRPLFTDRHSIWKLPAQAEANANTAAPTGKDVLGGYEGVKVVNNKDIQRVQLLFNERPSPETIKILKKSGWRWSPREGAWQRQNTQNGIYNVSYVMKQAGIKQIEAPKPTDDALRSIPSRSNELDTIIDGKGNIDYEKVSDVAGRIEGGSLEIRRLNPEIERGRLAGGKRNVEASILLAADARASEKAGPSRGARVDSQSDTSRRQEGLLEHYAKRNDIWFKQGHFPDRLYIDKGGEANVYRKSDDRVVKLVDYRHIDKSLTPQKFLDTRVSEFNYLFPESAYEVMGFMRDDNGRFRVIVTQPFIQGNPVNQQSDVDAFMQTKGLTRSARQSYANDLYEVHDLHEKNVIKAKDGTLYVIDAVPKVNEQLYQPFEITEKATDILRSVPQSGEPFYSQLERTIEQKMPNKASANQIRGIIKDTKAEERDWLGIDEWLDGKDSFTKAEVLEFVRANQVEVEEVVKGTEGDGWQGDDLIVDGERVANIVYNGEGTWSYISDFSDGSTEYESKEEAKSAAEEATIGNPYGNVGTKFSQYTLPGGENYRELLLTMPAPQSALSETQVQRLADLERMDTEDMTISQKNEWEFLTNRKNLNASNNEIYQSRHWEEPNVLAHVRYDERDGGKTLHIAEIQSDWGQQIRKDNGKTQKEYDPSKLTIEQVTATKNDAEWEALRNETPLFKEGDLIYKGTYPNPNDPHNIVRSYGKTKQDAENEMFSLFNRFMSNVGAAPDMPYKQSWPLMAFKRVLRHAAENGYERVTWDTGETSAERYDLSKQIDKLHYYHSTNPKSGYDYDIRAFKDGKAVIEKSVKVAELDGLVGKDIAQRIINDEGKPTNEGEWNKQKHPGQGELSGLDLKVGGEGMKAFYDRILPAEVNKYVKKWGGKVERGEVDAQEKLYIYRDRYGVTHQFSTEEAMLNYRVNNTGGTIEEDGTQSISVHSLTITPAMRDSVMAGQPLFKLRTAESIAELEALKRVKQFDDLEGMSSRVKGSTVYLDTPLTVEITRTLLAAVSGGDRDAQPILEGLFRDPEQVAEFVEAANVFADTFEDMGVDAKGVRELAKNIEKAAKPKGAMKFVAFEGEPEAHEDRHFASWLGATPEAKKDLAKRYKNPEQFESDPSFNKFRDALDKLQGYRSSLGAAIEEVIGYKADLGGLTADERAELLAKVVTSYADANGVESLSNFTEEEGTELYEAIETYRKGESRKTGDAGRSGQREGRQAGSGTTEGKSAEDDRGGRKEAFTPGGVEKKRRSPTTLSNAGIPVREQVYTSTTNPERVEFAQEQLEKGLDSAIEWTRQQLDDNNNNAGATAAVGINAMIQLGKEGRIDELNKLANDLLPSVTDAAQTVQAMSIVSMFSPETAGVYAAKAAKRNGKDITQNDIDKATTIAKEMSEVVQTDAVIKNALDEAERLNKEYAKEIADLREAVDIATGKNKEFKAKLSGQGRTIASLRRQLEGTLPKMRTSREVRQKVNDLKARKQEILDALTAKYGANQVLRMVAASNAEHFRKPLSHLLGKPNQGMLRMMFGEEIEVFRKDKAFTYSTRYTSRPNKTFPIDVVGYGSPAGTRYVALDDDLIVAAAMLDTHSKLIGVITEVGFENVGIGTNLTKLVFDINPTLETDGVVSKQGQRLLERAGKADEILRSVPPKTAGQDEIDWSVIFLAENLGQITPDEFKAALNTVTNGNLSPDELTRVHALAVAELRTTREVGDDIKAANKLRQAHYRAADKYNNERFEIMGFKTGNPVNKYIQAIIKAGINGNYSDAAIWVALARRADPNVDLTLAKLREEFPDLTASERRRALVESQVITKSAVAMIKGNGIQAQNEWKLNQEDIDLIKAERKDNALARQRVTRNANRFYEGLTKGTGEILLDTAVNFRRANLLTAVKTHFVNILGNTSFAVSEEIARVPSTWVDMAASLLTGERTTTLSPKAIINGAKTLIARDDTLRNSQWESDEGRESGRKAAVHVLRYGGSIADMERLQHSESILSEQFKGPVPRWIDNYINGVFRALGAEDAFFKVYAFRRSIEEQARAIALTEKRTDQAVNTKDRTAELTKNPTNVMQVNADRYAHFMTFQNDNRLSDFIASIKRGRPALKAGIEIVMPYDRTPTNIVMRTLEYSPLGVVTGSVNYKLADVTKDAKFRAEYVGAVKADLAKTAEFNALTETERRKLVEQTLAKAYSREQQAKFATTMGRATIGTTLFGLGFALAAAGIMTGAMDFGDDDDRKEKDEARRRKQEGIENGSILIPRFGRIVLPKSPATAAMVAGATFYEQMRMSKKNGVESVAGAGVEAMSDVMSETPIINSTYSLLRLARKGRVGEFTGNILSGFVPASAMVRSISEVTDSKERTGSGYFKREDGKLTYSQVRGFKNSLLKGIPGVRNYAVDESTLSVSPEERGGIGRRLVRVLEPLNTRSPKAYEVPVPASKQGIDVLLQSGEFKKATTDDVVMYFTDLLDLTDEDRQKLTEALRKKADNAKKAKTLTDDELRRVQSIIPDYSGETAPPRLKAPRAPTRPPLR